MSTWTLRVCHRGKYRCFTCYNDVLWLMPPEAARNANNT